MTHVPEVVLTAKLKGQAVESDAPPQPPPQRKCAQHRGAVKSGAKSLYDAHAPCADALEDHLGSTFLPLFIAKKMMAPMQSKPTTAPMAMPAMAPPDRPSSSSSASATTC